MTSSWDPVYLAAAPPPWDIGRAQPAFVRLAEAGRLTGRVLDVGCGTGEQTLMAAAHGAEAIGVDIARTAIERAGSKATERSIAALFEVADALDLGTLGVIADTIIDCGVFHVFSDEDRPRYVASLASVLRPGGSLCLMCFSDQERGGFGPRRVRQQELRESFSEGWAVESIEAETFEINRINTMTIAQAWLATIIRR